MTVLIVLSADKSFVYQIPFNKICKNLKKNATTTIMLVFVPQQNRKFSVIKESNFRAEKKITE